MNTIGVPKPIVPKQLMRIPIVVKPIVRILTVIKHTVINPIVKLFARLIITSLIIIFIAKKY